MPCWNYKFYMGHLGPDKISRDSAIHWQLREIDMFVFECSSVIFGRTGSTLVGGCAVQNSQIEPDDTNFLRLCHPILAITTKCHYCHTKLLKSAILHYVKVTTECAKTSIYWARFSKILIISIPKLNQHQSQWIRYCVWIFSPSTSFKSIASMKNYTSV